MSAKSKKWSIVTRDNGKLIRRLLGTYPDVGILRARKAAEDVIDHYNSLKAEKIRLEEMPMIDELCRDYAAKMKANGQVSYGSYQRNLLIGEFSLYSYLSTLPDHPFKAADISKSHVTEWLRQTNLRSPAHVRHCRSYLHAVFHWGLKADFDYTASPNKRLYGLIENPVAATPSSGGSKPRDRVLTKAEIKQYWEALPDYTSARTCLPSG